MKTVDAYVLLALARKEIMYISVREEPPVVAATEGSSRFTVEHPLGIILYKILHDMEKILTINKKEADSFPYHLTNVNESKPESGIIVLR